MLTAEHLGQDRSTSRSENRWLDAQERAFAAPGQVGNALAARQDLFRFVLGAKQDFQLLVFGQALRIVKPNRIRAGVPIGLDRARQ